MKTRIWIAVLIGAVLLSVVAGALVGKESSDTSLSPETAPAEVTALSDIGARTVPFYGEHQAGIETPAQANATFVALDLLPEVDREAIGRLMRLWTQDAAKLTQGEPIIGDSSPQMAENPSGLTITFGFGRGAFEQAGIADAWPMSIDMIPAYAIDRLERRWNDGDIVIQVAGDDQNTNFHAVHQLLRTGKSFVTPLWIQRGFLDAAGVNTGEIGRNLLGQVDGQANAPAGSSNFTQRTWMTAPAAMAGGTTMVLRRIQYGMDSWDKMSEKVKGTVIGRDLESGAPLSGGDATTPMDLEAMDPDGDSPAIGDNAHARLAFTDNNQGITRRGYNYDDGMEDGVRDVGLIFVSFQAQIERYLKIQEILARIDSLNKWTTPVGSAMFVVPPGTEQGGWIGETLFG